MYKRQDKTITVAIQDNVRHPLYNKIVKKTYKLKAHDEKNDAKIGDTAVSYTHLNLPDAG